MATCVLLMISILFPSAFGQDFPNKRISCDRHILEADFEIRNCQLNGDPVMSLLLPHDTTCFVTCKSKRGNGHTDGWKSCNHGNWEGHSIDCNSPVNVLKDAPKVNRDSHLRKKRGFFRAVLCWLFGCRRGPPPDRSPPRLTCPGDLTQYSLPRQTHAYFTWREPVALDNRDGHIRPIREGPSPGRLFASNATIRYVARDSSGNLGSCSFRITIKVIRCPPPQKITNGYFRCHPSTDFVKGGKCVFGCYSGHRLEGPSEVTCQDTWRWSDAPPVCSKMKCPPLLPPIDATMDCSDGFRFSSVCTFTCLKEGYAVPAGRRRVQVCRADGTWSGETPSCVDVTAPTFSKCPYVAIAAAGRSSDKARVVWHEPQVKDNSGERITAVQTKGRSSGSEFTVGHHDIEYTATDSAGNIARKCQFKVVVKELTCHALYATPYQTVTCPQGYRYGSKCTFDCDPEFSLAGSNVTSCEVTGSPSYAVWSFPKQPECKVANRCPKLRVPTNGAIVCDEWFQGVYCQLHCQNGTDIAPHFPHWELFVCGNSGIWNILEEDLHLNIPDCVARASNALVKYNMKARYYYNGHCNDQSVRLQIQTNFIDLLEKHPACLSVPECNVASVRVICGEIRNRRDASTKGLGEIRNRRNIIENNTVDIEVEFKFNSQSADKSAVETWKSRVYTVTSDTVHSSQLTVDGSSLTSGSVIVNEIDAECGNGSVINYRTFSCIKCPSGTFHNITGKSCDLCPRGQYQNQEGQLNCLNCLDGQSTASPGAKNPTDCRASCASGTFSKTGLPPCSPCPPGFYQPRKGQTQCMECPGVKTTVSQGSLSADSCQDFDVAFQPNDTTDTSTTMLDVNINVTSAVTLSMWMKCTEDCHGKTMLTFDKNNEENWFTLGGWEGSFKLAIGSTKTLTSARLITNQWHFLVLTLTPGLVTLWVDGQEYESVDLSGFTFINLQKLTLGGAGFTGKVSQLQVWSSAMSGATREKTCSSTLEGDVLSWKRFLDATFQEAFVDIPSQCDDVNDCASSPCMNGQCQDQLGSFYCYDCDLGWTGEFCDINEDDCLDNVCENNGTCVDEVLNFHCDCPDGFNGSYCEIAIVDGEWGEWSNWTSCNVTCGQGSRARFRMCDDPYPDNGGRDCQGEATQTQKCQEPDCIECPAFGAPTNGIKDCDVTSEATNCSISCNDGYMFDKDPLEEYICSVETLNTWNIQTDLNPLGRLPYCSKMVSARALSITFTASYHNTASLPCTGIDDEISNVTATLTAIIKTETECVKGRSCSMSDVKVTLCQGRTKRDTSSNLHFSVDISVNTGSQNSASIVETAYNNLQVTAEARRFDVKIRDVAYNVDVNTTSATPTIVCNPGHTTYSFWCVPCGPGSYNKDGLCEWCPVGSYQPMEAQSHCVTCSPGWTTIGYGSRSDGDCDVKLPTTTTTTSTTTTTTTSTPTTTTTSTPTPTTSTATTVTLTTTDLSITTATSVTSTAPIGVTDRDTETDSTASSTVPSPTATSPTTLTRTTTYSKGKKPKNEEYVDPLVPVLSSVIGLTAIIILVIVFVICRSRRTTTQSGSSQSSSPSLSRQTNDFNSQSKMNRQPNLQLDGVTSFNNDAYDDTHEKYRENEIRRGSSAPSVTSRRSERSFSSLFENREIFLPITTTPERITNC